MKNGYHFFLNVKNRYQILTSVKDLYQNLHVRRTGTNPRTCENWYQIITHMKNWYLIVTDVSETVENWNRMQNAADFGGILPM